MSFDMILTIRCNLDKLKLFREWCKKANIEYQDLIREVMEAAPEGRLTIKPSKAQKRALNKLYKGANK